jgi:hypothetical protein
MCACIRVQPARACALRARQLHACARVRSVSSMLCILCTSMLLTGVWNALNSCRSTHGHTLANDAYPKTTDQVDRQAPASIDQSVKLVKPSTSRLEDVFMCLKRCCSRHDYSARQTGVRRSWHERTDAQMLAICKCIHVSMQPTLSCARRSWLIQGRARVYYMSNSFPAATRFCQTRAHQRSAIQMPRVWRILCTKELFFSRTHTLNTRINDRTNTVRWRTQSVNACTHSRRSLWSTIACVLSVRQLVCAWRKYATSSEDCPRARCVRQGHASYVRP